MASFRCKQIAEKDIRKLIFADSESHSEYKDGMYSGHRITLSFGYVTERGEGKMERAGGSKTAKNLPEHV
jgi:hypothetical protein